MRLLFVISGIGFGDATREDANITSIKNIFPNARIMVAGYDHSYDYFKNKYKTIKIHGYKLAGKTMKVSALRFALQNILLPAFWVLGTLKVSLRYHKFTPDVIVSDFEPVGISLARVLKKPCVVIFGYDPLLYREYKRSHKTNYKLEIEARYFEKLYTQADIVLIPTLKKKREKHLLYTYINPIIRTQPEELGSEKKLMAELRLKKKPVIVMLGGSQFGTKLAKNINKCASLFPNEDFFIFGGKLNISLNKNVHYISYTSEFLKYLKVSKGIITLAGQKTLSEALVYKKPILCFPIKDHVEQLLNAYALEGTAMISHSSSFWNVKTTLAQFLRNLPLLQQKVERLGIEGNGSEDVVKVIETLTRDEQ